MKYNLNYQSKSSSGENCADNHVHSKHEHFSLAMFTVSLM